MSEPLLKPWQAEGRVKLSPHHWRKLKEKMWAERGAGLTCALCGKAIYFFDDFQLDHIKPRGMGSGSRNDSPDNLQPAHSLCNQMKGSKRG